MKYIELSSKNGKNHRTKVDDSTFKEYGHLSWYLSDTGYALRTVAYGLRSENRKRHIRLHRVITDAPESLEVDHLNGDKLDNRKSNLRLCTHKENMGNRKNTKGYIFNKRDKSWVVRYRGEGRGSYKTEPEAKRAYQLACSGAPYVKKRRKYYHLPKNVSRQFGKYVVRIQVDGKRHWLGQYATIDEAKNKLIKWQEMRITP